MAEAPPSAQGRESQDRRSAPGSSARQTGTGGPGDGSERTFGGRGGRQRGGPGKGDKEKGDGKEQWTPATKLGRLVKAGKVRSLESIYNFSLPIKEYQIIDHFLPSPPVGTVLVDEVLKIMPVQKQTPSGQRTRFKAFVVVGDRKGHVGLGVKCSKEVATAIRGAIIAAKLSIVPVRLGYWGNKIGAPHTVPTKVTGKCGSVRVRLVPAPRGTGIVAAGTPHKLLSFAGVDDVYTKCQGHTKTLGNFAIATFNAIQATFEYQTPDLWKANEVYKMDPYQEFQKDLESLAAEGKREEAKRAERLDDRSQGREGGRGGRFGGDRDFREGGFGGRREGGGFRGRREDGNAAPAEGASAEGNAQQGEGQQGEQSGFGRRPQGEQGSDSGFGRQRREGDGGFRGRREDGNAAPAEGASAEGNAQQGEGQQGEQSGFGRRPQGEQGSDSGFGRQRREGDGGFRGRRDGGEGGYRGGRGGDRGFGGDRSDRPARSFQSNDSQGSGAQSQSSQQ
eukprot:TRINITY_DN31_c0_g1_i2.p1 TRINITY_DN31_c0_g1~~TRINITY_DN31_c0_g1_i2.p1  ORF type:complete len:506 (-),score=151.60 TRINITY_DN31_c0_g1_i2:107-1624(-)